MAQAGVALSTPSRKQVIDLPLFMLRVAGMPIHELLRMRIPLTMKCLKEMTENQRWIEANTQWIIEKIEQEVPKQKDDKIRNQLIQYKRDIFNNRFPKKRSDHFHSVLPSSLLEQMKQWEEVWLTIKKLKEEASQHFPQELTKNREVLQEIIQDPNLLRGVVLTSRDLYYKVKKYIETPIPKQKARLRKVEYSLSKYISRVAAKTSPFSTFTSVGIGEWSSEHKDGKLHIASLQHKSHVQLNYANLLRVVDGLVKQPAVRKHLSYKVNPTLIVDEGKVKYIRRLDDSQRRARVFKTLETPVSLNLNPAIQAVFSILQSEDQGKIGFIELAKRLTEQLSTAPENVEKFLHQLIDLAILVPDLHLYEQTNEIIPSILELIKEWPEEIAQRTGSRLQDMEDILAQYGSASVEERAAYLQRVKEIYRDICTDLQIEISETSLGLLVYEDAILQEKSSFSLDNWKEYLNDLVAYQSIAPIFDVKFRIQSAIAQKFIEMYGEDGVCDKPGQFLSTVVPTLTEFYSAFLPTALPKDLELKNELKPIRILNELQREMGELLLERFKNEQEEVHLTHEELTSFAERIPKEIARRPLSHDCFVQLVSRSDGEDLLVLNQMYLGNTTFFTRFLSYFPEEEITQLLRNYLSTLYEKEGVLAEISGVYGFNANLHPPLTPYELSLPMLSPTRDKGEKINWEDLVMVYNKEKDRVILRHPELGEVTTLFLGTLIPMLIPFVVNFMATNFSNGHFSNWFHLFAEQKLTEEEKQQVRVYPRISVGRVVVARKKWIFPRSQLVYREARDDEFSYFTRVHEWRKKWDLPDRLFFRLAAERQSEESTFSLDPQATANTEEIDFTDFKPQYLDFENPLLVRMFGKMIADNSYYVIMEEMLPDIDNLALSSDGSSYVSELLVELSRPGLREE